MGKRILTGNIRRLACVLIVMGVFATGCTPAAGTAANPTQTRVLPASTLTPGSTATLPYNGLPTAKLPPTLVPTQTPAIDVPIVVAGKCMDLETILPPDLALPGVWVRNPGAPYLEDVEKHTRMSIPLKGGGAVRNGWNGNMAISPDGKLLAYLDGYIRSSGYQTDKWDFRIIRSNGQLLTLNNWTYDTRRILGWTSNNEIALEVYSQGQKYLVYTPASGATREIHIDPAIKKANTTWQPELEPGVNYFNPDRILLNTRDGIELYDVQNGGKLNGIDFGYVNDAALWSPDLATLLITAYSQGDAGDLYAIRNDKVLLQLNGLKTGMTDQALLSIRGFGWSPDSKTFLVGAYGSHVALMHLDNLKLTGLCLNNDTGFEEYWIYTQPVWSPDSRYLVLNNGNGDILIDVEQMRAFKLPTSGSFRDRIGWLANP